MPQHKSEYLEFILCVSPFACNFCIVSRSDNNNVLSKVRKLITLKSSANFLSD